jgi:hypothetical protein
MRKSRVQVHPAVLVIVGVSALEPPLHALEHRDESRQKIRIVIAWYKSVRRSHFVVPHPKPVCSSAGFIVFSGAPPPNMTSHIQRRRLIFDKRIQPFTSEQQFPTTADRGGAQLAVCDLFAEPASAV